MKRSLCAREWYLYGNTVKPCHLKLDRTNKNFQMSRKFRYWCKLLIEKVLGTSKSLQHIQVHAYMIFEKCWCLRYCLNVVCLNNKDFYQPSVVVNNLKRVFNINHSPPFFIWYGKLYFFNTLIILWYVFHVSWLTYKSLFPGNSLMRAEHDPEPRTRLASFFPSACSRSSKSPPTCKKLQGKTKSSESNIPGNLCQKTCVINRVNYKRTCTCTYYIPKGSSFPEAPWISPACWDLYPASNPSTWTMNAFTWQSNTDMSV